MKELSFNEMEVLEGGVDCEAVAAGVFAATLVVGFIAFAAFPPGGVALALLTDVAIGTAVGQVSVSAIGAGLISGGVCTASN